MLNRIVLEIQKALAAQKKQTKFSLTVHRVTACMQAVPVIGLRVGLFLFVKSRVGSNPLFIQNELMLMRDMHF